MQKNAILYVSESSNSASLALSFWYIVNIVTWRYRISVIYQKATPTQVLSCKILRTPFSTEQLRSAAARCVLGPFERYGCPKNEPKKILVTLFPYIFHLKPRWNIVYEHLKTKIFSRDSNILPQMHWISNIFGHSATTIGGFWVSLNYPIVNFKKTVCPKNVWVRHCSGGCFLR